MTITIAHEINRRITGLPVASEFCVVIVDYDAFQLSGINKDLGGVEFSFSSEKFSDNFFANLLAACTQEAFHCYIVLKLRDGTIE